MKTLKSYRYFSLKESLKITTSQEEEGIIITLKDNNTFIGNCFLDIKIDAYYYFENDITDEEYIKLFDISKRDLISCSYSDLLL